MEICGLIIPTVERRRIFIMTKKPEICILRQMRKEGEHGKSTDRKC